MPKLFRVFSVFWLNVHVHLVDGIGKPEPLKHNNQGLWSRRVNDEDRIVYDVTDSAIIVHSLKGHHSA
jgi:Txe/YoeB family toxin of toxin-antitoxin system